MFEARLQTFDAKTDPSKGRERVAALRAELAKRKLDGFIVPRADEHQNEYVPACEDRLGWLTGFSGSTGVAVVLAEKAALFVDGRYTIEARAQIDPNVFAIQHLIEHPPEEWLAKNLKAGDAFGYDPARARRQAPSFIRPNPIRSMRFGLSGQSRRSRRLRCVTCTTPVKRARQNSRASAKP